MSYWEVIESRDTSVILVRAHGKSDADPRSRTPTTDMPQMTARATDRFAAGRRVHCHGDDVR